MADTTKCDGLEGQIAFRNASRKAGSPAVGADYIMVIRGYEELTFLTKTHGVPILKNDEKVEYTSTHGVKDAVAGYIQTLNTLNVTFIDDKEGKVIDSLNEIKVLCTEDLEILYFKGRTLSDMKYHGRLSFASIHQGEPIEGDSEGTSAPSQIPAEITGHWLPAKYDENKEDILDVLEGLI